jgi:integrase
MNRDFNALRGLSKRQCWHFKTISTKWLWKLLPLNTGLRMSELRHLKRAGVDMFKIKDWMGHKSVNTTLRYVHLARHYDSDIELIAVWINQIW